ncbi:hypothetical protein Lgee_0153 [Legionella geestiana]|uniref:Uncharacterized protein n=1 Tax=Legionella geestiana TaxID=45065 RepID=A0A0W0U917_9GAMM|nr:hypothetical protein Lgee_0153 [Legionella geestiana]STX54552.1 Uncharacterised protein [Legionella geestiana]
MFIYEIYSRRIICFKAIVFYHVKAWILAAVLFANHLQMEMVEIFLGTPTNAYDAMYHINCYRELTLPELIMYLFDLIFPNLQL